MKVTSGFVNNRDHRKGGEMCNISSREGEAMEYDTLYYNGKIITVESPNEIMDWVAVKDGKICCLGKGDKPPADVKSSIDLNGKTMLPGLIDSHVHVMTTGFFLNSVDLTDTSSIDEAKALLKEKCLQVPKGEWVFGVGFMAYKMKEERYPDRKELDGVSEDHPVMIAAQTLHGASFNSMGISRIKIPEVDGVGYDENGQLNGVLLSDDAVFPAMSQTMALLSDEKLLEFIKECDRYAASRGVTTISGLLGQFVEGDVDVDLILKNSDDFLTDIVPFYQTWNLDKVKELGLPRIGGCLTLDGAGFEYTMALQEPYPERPERRGFLIHTDEEIYQLLSKAHRENIQCAFHALGDRAIDQVVYIYNQVIGEQGKKDLRHRIEHFSLPSDKHMDLACELGLVLSMQPAFSGLWGNPEDGVYIPMLGQERADRMEVFSEIVKRGGLICGGSDSPVTLPNPLFGMACCINNPDPRRNITVHEALKVFTYNGAYAVNMEDSKGTISEGKDADFTVIDRNPYDAADSNEIFDMKVLETIKNGETIFKA